MNAFNLISKRTSDNPNNNDCGERELKTDFIIIILMIIHNNFEKCIDNIKFITKHAFNNISKDQGLIEE